MGELILRFLKNDSGVTAIEYALLTAGLTVIIITAVTNVGTSLIATFSNISNTVAG
jgi:pilus assembly protein Flp/PilA